MTAESLPECPDGSCSQCGLRVTASYRCTACDFTVDVPGTIEYNPDVEDHFHVADDYKALILATNTHKMDTHNFSPSANFMPYGDSGVEGSIPRLPE